MIGDWVKQKHSGLLLKVCAIEPPYVRADGEGGQFHEDTIEPISVTEEMLKANGYEERAASCADSSRWKEVAALYHRHQEGA